MERTVSIRKVAYLSLAEIERCRELTYGIGGFMEEDLMAAVFRERDRKPYRYTKAILVKEGDNIIAWSLVMPAPYSPLYSAHFYVDEFHRGRGHGRLLYEEAARLSRRPLRVYPDIDNQGFFKKVQKQHSTI